MTEDPRPTIAERYAKAAQTSDLRLREERLGDADVIAAAGMVRATLGSLLLRLRNEFDAVHAEIKGQGANAETDRVLVLIRLKSLPAARDRLRQWGEARAASAGLSRPARELAALIGRALDCWLSPTCSPCEGRGHNGGYDGPQLTCTHCGGTGKRRQRLGQEDAERAFAADLLVHMDRMTADAEAQMTRALHGFVAGDKLSPEQERVLRQRLQDLRSSEAQGD